MQVPAMSHNDPTADHILRSDADVEVFSELECEMIAHIESAHLMHHGPETNYRPYLHLRGEMRSLLSKQRLPNNITEMTWGTGLGPLVDVFYEFDNDQMGSLVAKGYYDGNLEVPQDFSDAMFEFDTTAQAIIVSAEQEGDAPLVFVDVPNRDKFVTNWEDSGYNLEEDFREFVPETQLDAGLDQEAQNELEDELSAINERTPDREDAAEHVMSQSQFDTELESASYEAQAERPQPAPEPLSEHETILASVESEMDSHFAEQDKSENDEPGFDDDSGEFENLGHRDDEDDERDELDPEIYGTEALTYREGVETDRDSSSSEKERIASQARIHASLEAAAAEIAREDSHGHHHASDESSDEHESTKDGLDF